MTTISRQFNDTIASVLAAEQPQAFNRLQSEVHSLQQHFTQKTFFYLFAICPRWFEKKQHVSSAELMQLDVFDVCGTWTPSQFARLYIILAIADQPGSDTFASAFNQLFQTADVNELILLVQSLQFISDSERFVARAREAARSNIESVFSAIAHNSDYAFRFFDQGGWNQLILKAAFLSVPIWTIYGLRERNNAELVNMIKNYIEERQVAKRNLPWDLWACLGWAAASDADLAYLYAQFEKLDGLSKAAILLSLRENMLPGADKMATAMSAQLKDLDPVMLGWSGLAELRTKLNQ